MQKKVWLITGVSSGFGREWCIGALERGDQVIGTTRSLTDSEELSLKYPDRFMAIVLDVTNRAACFETVEKGINYFGTIDILVNNAGYGQFGYVEELSESEIRAQIETNVFGSIWMLQAMAPIFRKQKFGHILQLSSIGGLLSLPGVSMYHATKYAMEGICDSLSQELKDFGVHVTLLEPGSFATDFATRSAKTAVAMKEYDPVREKRKLASKGGSVGRLEATTAVVFKLVDNPNPPLRLLMGINVFERVEAEYQNRISTWKEWYNESRDSHGEVIKTE
ncbi:MAG: SDR family NAD(P)-dependent oxidoreductase [Bacteroidetes bacterium]|nr:SDR family NAD(P)-dependent oxidoreductase [Bacteroidota bacterium]